MSDIRGKKSGIISEYCDNLFFKADSSDKLLVFLPSVNGKGVYPYYPRVSWSGELSENYNVLYLSDPYQPLSKYDEPMGSWFVSPDGISTLEVLSDKIKKLAGEIKASNIVFYGSSMGGYAAIILSSLVKGAKSVAECPQLYLNKHPGSRYVCENILSEEVCVNSVEPLYYIKTSPPKHIRLVCSVFDRHYSHHVLPFIKDVANVSEEASFSVVLQAYISSEYKKGHVAMNKKDAVKVIDEVFCL